MFTLLFALAAAMGGPSARDLLPPGGDQPGCALDVRRDGRTIETTATGLANLENPAPITANTVFEVGSVSKQFIGAGIAMLTERGRLRLDDPIVKWLPELPPLYRGITIDMLVHHTSGIRSWNNLAELTGRGEDSTGYDNGWVLRALGRQQRLNSAPGAEYLYSNSNFVLAAIIIERASGQELNAFYRETLFKRLGMTHTRWRTDFRAIVPDRAQAYGPESEGGWQLDMPLNDVAGAGGLLSTVADLQRWNATLADPSAGDRAWVAALLGPGALSDGRRLSYGMGIETAAVAGRPAFSHAGSTGSYRAWLGFFPAERLSIALLCNSGAVNTENLGPKVAARFLPKAAVSPVASGRLAPVSSSLAGVYRNVSNDSLVRAEVDATGLHLNNGPSFAAAGPDKLTTADAGRVATVLRGRRGAVTGLAVSRPGNSPVRLERVAAWAPAPRELRSLAGEYSSVEVEGVQRIELSGGRLSWRDPSGATHKLDPIYQDAFEAPDVSWVLRFRRIQNGRVALDMSITRARRIAFRKVEEVALDRPAFRP